MLERLSAVSKRLYWTKPIAVLLGLVFISLFVTSLLGLAGFDTDTLLIPSLLGALWSTLYYILLAIFPSVPVILGKELTFMTRIKVRLQRGMYYVLAIMLITLTIVILLLSFRLLGIWRTEF